MTQLTRFSEAEKRRIRWQSRRGLLELDLLLGKFLAKRYDQLSDEELVIYCRILDLPDNDFLDLLNGKVIAKDAEIMAMVAKILDTKI